MDSFTKTLTLNMKTTYDKSGLDVTQKAIEGLKKTVESVKLFDSKETEQSLIKIKNDFQNLAIVKNNLFSDKELADIKKVYDTEQEKLYKINTLKQEIEELETYDKSNNNLEEMKRLLKQLQGDIDYETDDTSSKKEGKLKTFGKSFKNEFKEWFDDMKDMSRLAKSVFNNIKMTIAGWARKALASIKQFVKDAITEIKEMASWSSTSNVFNKDAASMYMNYGLTGKDAYAMSKALETQGFGSIDEYLENLPFMNQQQLDYMKEIAEISAEDYDNSIETSKVFQEFEKEYAVFKKELQSSLIDFFMSNKDVIIGFFKFAMNALDGILKVVTALTEFFTGPKSRTESERKQAMADILGITSTSTTTNTTNNKQVKIDNTFNGVGKADQSWLTNVGQMTYLPIIQALK